MTALPYHPCINEAAHAKVARIHLPVAPKCNTDCGYCSRGTFVPLTESGKPGACSRVLSPSESLLVVSDFLEEWGESSIVGIAGPGDPLANEETFETLALLNKRHPGIRLCLCTNGLNLPQEVSRLKRYNVDHISITMNGIDPDIISQIHSYVEIDGEKIKGRTGAEFLIANQISGLQMAVQSGIFVKVNSVVIPGINDHHLPEVARYLSESGAGIMNVMPLIPGGRFKDIAPPSLPEMEKLYNSCGKYLPVFKKCRQCRADAKGIPGKETCTWQQTA